jgi:uncharacterized membrane protein required for colicin V production
VDIGALLSGANLFDLVIFLSLFAAFLIGFMQGTIRRLLGILSMVFSFFLAANL